jgi:hypothetical protein
MIRLKDALMAKKHGGSIPFFLWLKNLFLVVLEQLEDLLEEI